MYKQLGKAGYSANCPGARRIKCLSVKAAFAIDQCGYIQLEELETTSPLSITLKRRAATDSPQLKETRALRQSSRFKYNERKNDREPGRLRL